MIATEAVIQTRKRTVAMLAKDKGRFRPVDVEIDIESDGKTEIRRGLKAGQQVVFSSQFLVNSEASLKGVEVRLNVEPQPAAANTAPRHTGSARIQRSAFVAIVSLPLGILMAFIVMHSRA